MSDYVKTTNFASKDGLTTGDPLKLIKGTEIGAEFDAVASASSSKSNKITSATLNNLVAMTASGDIKDSTITTDGAGTITADLVGDVTGNADTVTTNANLTGPITSVGNATSIATGVVTSTHIANGTITSTDIASNTITSGNIASNTITAGDIATNAIGVAELKTSTMTYGSITLAAGNNIIPAGLYTMAPPSATTGYVYLEVWSGSAWQGANINWTGGAILSDGANINLKNNSGGTIPVYYRKLA